MPKPSVAIAAFAAVVDPARVGEAEGVWVMLIPAGTFRDRDGRGPYRAGDRVAMQAVVDASLARAGKTEIVIDYDHQSVFAAVPNVGGRAPAAGWIRGLEVRDDGIWGRVAWTEAAAAAIRAGEYRYLSPVFSHDEAGKVGVIVNAGLTNNPALDLAGAVAARTEATTTTGDTMKAIAKALGLAEDADETAILAALAARDQGLTAVATALGLGKDATVTAMTAAIAAKASPAAPDPAKFVPIEQVTAMQTQLTQLMTSIATDKATAAVNAAIEAGKLAPALKAWGLDLATKNPEQFAAFVATAPQIVTPGGRPAAGAPPGGEPVITESDRAVMSAMGITEADFLKSKKELAV